MAYQTATLKGVGAYDLTSLVRGAHGSTVGGHVAGKPFVRMDDALFKYSFDKSWLGKTVWVKLVSYNIYGSGMQNLSEVPAYSYAIVGAPLGQVTNLRLTSAWSYGKNASIAWDKLESNNVSLAHGNLGIELGLLYLAVALNSSEAVE